MQGVPVTSDLDLRVVHGLRVRGLIDTPEFAVAVGLEESEVGARIAGLAEAGRVRRRDGHMPGWALTPEGRAHGVARIA